MWMWIQLIVYAICLIVMRIALRKGAYGRFVFISLMGFVVAFMVELSPSNIARYVAWAFQGATWIFVLFMTWKSVVRMKETR